MASAIIECHIGKASDTIETPSAFVGEANFLRHHFLAGSDQAIDLSPRNRIDEGPVVRPNATVVDALDLHRAVERLAANPPGSSRVSRVALILAGEYGPRPGIFGIMFDRGRPTDDDPNKATQFTATPREGCAIFVNAIRKLRPTPIDFDVEVEFTAVHELGHLFNLDHLDRHFGASFMATSDSSRPHGEDYFHFTGGQREWLSECATNPWVYPGGSPYQPVSGENASSRRPRQVCTSPEVELRIGIENSVFPCAVPVELDVSLNLASDSERSIRILDRLDPGYDEFAIWITYPNGDRRRFRSPRRYCGPLGRRTLKSGQSFARDISVFADAGGAVFVTPGIYHLSAEFDLGRRGRVVSSTIAVEAVASFRLLSPVRRALLLDPAVRSLLYHRKGDESSEVLQRVSRHLEDEPQGSGANDLRYALARVLHVRGAREPMADAAVREHILKVWDTPGGLGRRQQFHLERIFQDLVARSGRDA